MREGVCIEVVIGETIEMDFPVFPRLSNDVVSGVEKEGLDLNRDCDKVIVGDSISRLEKAVTSLEGCSSSLSSSRVGKLTAMFSSAGLNMNSEDNLFGIGSTYVLGGSPIFFVNVSLAICVPNRVLVVINPLEDKARSTDGETSLLEPRNFCTKLGVSLVRR